MIGLVGRFDQAEDFGIEGHAEGQAHLDEFLLVDEDVGVVSEDGGGEGEGFVGADAAVGPDFEGEFVAVGAAADAGVDDVVFDAPDGREEGVDGNEAGNRTGFCTIW